MSNNLKDILNNLSKDIEQEKLLQYLNSKLPDNQQHDIEAQMNNDDFLNDAMEGLQELNNKKDIPVYIQQLNDDLKHQLQKKKSRKDKRKIPSQQWVTLSIIIILILAVIAFVIINKFIR